MSDPHPDCPICRAPDPRAAPRHVAAWGELTAAEQFTLLARLGEALAAGAAGFAVATDHGHFQLRPGGAQALRLTTGAADPLLPLIAQGIDGADSVELAVAFAMDSGVQLIAPWFRDLLDRGGRLRVVVGDYMDVTEPAALHRLAMQPEPQAAEAPAPFTTAGPDLWREYLREDIPPLFGARFSPGNWNAGIVRLDNTLILLTTLKKGGLTAGSH